MLVNPVRTACEKYRLDSRDIWTAIHHRRRLVLASGLSLNRQLEWAQRLKVKAMRQRPYRIHLICLSAAWEGNLLQRLREQNPAMEGERNMRVV